ncbi:MAG: glycosyltransferase family 1 protein, partial [Patescibacteria group bacterium]|nr:glycosyltransferase family 1 protein [Patescibacteria group bacterium]
NTRFCVPTNANFKLKTIKSQFPFWTYTKLPREIKKDKPDILFMPIQAVPFFNKPKNIKIVITVHDLAFLLFPDHFTAKDRFLLNFHTKRAVKMADKIIAPSEATKKDIMKFYEIDENKIKVIYHGVSRWIHSPVGLDASSIHKQAPHRSMEPTARSMEPTARSMESAVLRKAQDDSKQVRDESPYILFVGTIQPRKNIVRLIEAFETIKTRRNEALPRSYNNLKLIIAGGRGWMANETYRKAKKSKFSKDIVLKGKVSDEELKKLYQNALMFVLPSLYEGFGLPILEAMNYGLPCIVSDNSSFIEIANDRALFVNPESSDDIAQKIDMFLNNEFLRKDFSQRSLENVKKFSWNKSAKEMLEIFKSI